MKKEKFRIGVFNHKAIIVNKLDNKKIHDIIQKWVSMDYDVGRKSNSDIMNYTRAYVMTESINGCGNYNLPIFVYENPRVNKNVDRVTGLSYTGMYKVSIDRL